MPVFQPNQQSSKLNIDLPFQASKADLPPQSILVTSTQANFSRSGNDLVIKNLGNSQILDDYFVNPVPLKTLDGVILSIHDIKLSLHNEPIRLVANDITDLIISPEVIQIGIITAIVEGPVTVSGEDGRIRLLNEGDPVYLHDTIVTGASTYVKIILSDGTVFQLGSQSRASLDKYAYDPDEPGGEFETYVYSGGFRYISGKISGDNVGQHTMIKTPSANIGIRGSEISGWIDAYGSTTILHLSGLVTLTSQYFVGEINVYERGTSAYIPNDYIPYTISQLTEEQIQQNMQEWSVLNGLAPVEDNMIDLKGHENISTISPDIGTQNPFSPASINVNSDESVDEISFADEPIAGIGTETAPTIDEAETILTTLTLELDNIADTKPADDDTKPADDDTEPADDDTSENIPPTANDDGPFEISQNSNSIIITKTKLLANDSDPDDVLTITAIGNPSHGTLEHKGEQVVFTPEPNFSGEASFEYTIEDSSGATATATVIINVIPNIPPIITLPNSSTPLVYNVTDQPLAIDSRATVTDPDSPNFYGGTLQVVINNHTPNEVLEIQNQGQITVSDNRGGLIFFDNSLIGNFSTNSATGALLVSLNVVADPQATTALLQAITYKNTSAIPLTDARTIEITLTDGDGETSNVVSRNVEITIANSPPEAQNDSVAIPFNTPTTISVADLLANDSDANPADIISISDINTSNGTKAELINNEVQLFVDGLVNDNFDAITFDYTINDGNGGTDSATVTVTPNNVITGTEGDDTLEGTDNLDIIIGKEGNDIFMSSQSSDILLGGDGDDLFLLDPEIAANGVYINGNNGSDTLSFSGVGNQLLDLVTNRALPSDQQLNLQGIDEIDLNGNNNKLILSIDDVLDISDANSLVIDGNANNMLTSVGQGWISDGIDSSGLYNRYLSGEAELLVSVDITSQFIS